MKNIIRKILKEQIRLVLDKQEETPLEKYFGVKTNTNRFIKTDELFYDIYRLENKIGYLVLSNEKYDEYDFHEILDGNIVYLNFIRLHEEGNLREVIGELKDTLKTKYDYLVLEIMFNDLDSYHKLKTKYEKIGFIGISPYNVGEFDLGLPNDFDIYENDIFMYLPLKS